MVIDIVINMNKKECLFICMSIHSTMNPISITNQNFNFVYYFLDLFLKNTHIHNTSNVMYLSMIYISKIKHSIKKKSMEYIFITAFLLAYKWINDGNISLDYISKYLNIDKNILCENERSVLKYLDYNLNVSSIEFDHYKQELNNNYQIENRKWKQDEILFLY